MRVPTLLLISVLSLSATESMAASQRRHAVVEINVQPPEPRVVVAPAPRQGHVWAPGYWGWNGHKHVWNEGRWIRERRGEHWQPAHWEESRHGYWHFEKGHWEH
jgi:WXXGXW repeat (2 copies)